MAEVAPTAVTTAASAPAAHEIWWQDTLDFLPKLLLGVGVLVVAYAVAKAAKRITLRSLERRQGPRASAAGPVSYVVYFVLLLAGAFMALEIVGLEGVVTKLLAGAGIVGIVAGFAFKDIAANAFAGLLLNMHRPFKAGDWVAIADQFGTVDTIGWITTSIRSVTGQLVFVPNQIIYTAAFTNYSTFGKRRVVLSAGVSYGDDLDQVKRVALDEVGKIDALLPDEAVDFYFTAIASSTYDFELRFWIAFTHQRDFLAAQSELIMRIKARFERENISLAYSVLTLDFGVKGGVNLHDRAVPIAAHPAPGDLATSGKESSA